QNAAHDIAAERHRNHLARLIAHVVTQTCDLTANLKSHLQTLYAQSFRIKLASSLTLLTTTDSDEGVSTFIRARSAQQRQR
ncbi:hypothetical protein KC221_29345, partial [Mycobacterium tuberculosis]|nr:hypothetical protein [Mycobacterium tuberculosis]